MKTHIDPPATIQLIAVPNKGTPMYVLTFALPHNVIIVTVKDEPGTRVTDPRSFHSLVSDIVIGSVSESYHASQYY